MKKFLVVAVLVAASVMPTMPSVAAEKLTEREAGPVLCFLLPLLPKCVEYWKGKGEDAKAKWDDAVSK